MTSVRTDDSQPPSEGALSGELLDLAGELAVAAGAIALDRRRQGLSVSAKSSSTDLVTDADRAVEHFLVTELARRRPADAVLAEEGTQGTGRGSGVRWVIDPIDGTVNYLLGHPQFAVSIAAESNEVTIAGCVYNPVSQDLFTARRGNGAQLNGEPLSGPRSVPLADAVVATGFAYDRLRRAHQGQVIAGLLPRVGNLRRGGSAALELCGLAAGWVDAFFEAGLHEWDYAAGLLIAHEAGVTSSGLLGRPAGEALVAATGAPNANEFFELLTELGAADPVESAG